MSCVSCGVAAWAVQTHASCSGLLYKHGIVYTKACSTRGLYKTVMIFFLVQNYSNRTASVDAAMLK